MSHRRTTAPSGPVRDPKGSARRAPAAVRPPPTADIDNTSVAGEEDPGAALEFTRPGRSGANRNEEIRPARCDR